MRSRQDISEAFSSDEIFVIDGAMSTALERLGCDLQDSLWTASILAKQPELIKQVHQNYFHAGADCGITCSYQASIPGLLEHGYSEAEAERLLRLSVQLLLDAGEEWWEKEGRDSGRRKPFCLASVGPYGAYLADGSEYRGNYGIEAKELEKFHRRRMEILWDAGADVLLMETFPSLEEAKITAAIAEKMDADYWISFSCKDGGHMNDGAAIETCAKVFAIGHPHCKCIGVNCIAPEYVEELIGRLKECCDLPIAVYPNSGEEYDPVTKAWHGGRGACPYDEYAKRWIAAGADAVGGCCRTVESHIQMIRAAAANRSLRNSR